MKVLHFKKSGEIFCKAVVDNDYDDYYDYDENIVKDIVAVFNRTGFSFTDIFIYRVDYSQSFFAQKKEARILLNIY